MNGSLNVLFGFLHGSILSVDGGYQVLPKHPSSRIFTRLADAKWFLALQWCEHYEAPAGILNNTGQFSFQNASALQLGTHQFIPADARATIFQAALDLMPQEIQSLEIPLSVGLTSRALEIQCIEIDPRYGKVALIREPIASGELASI